MKIFKSRYDHLKNYLKDLKEINEKLIINRQNLCFNLWDLTSKQVDKLADKISKQIKQRQELVNECQKLINSLIKSNDRPVEVINLINNFKDLKDSMN